MIGDNNFFNIALYAVGTNIAALSMRWIFHRKAKSNLQYLGKVESLIIRPLKSCGGFEVEEVECTNNGLSLFNGVIKDRHFAVVADDTSQDPGRVITLRQCPELVLVKCRVQRAPDGSVTIHFSAPGMKEDLILPMPLKVKGDVFETKLWGQPIRGLNCGTEAARWFQEYLKRTDVILLHANDKSHLRQLLPEFTPIPQRQRGRVTSNDRFAYSDCCCVHLVNTTSVDDLNRRITADGTADPIVAENFRPTILMSNETSFIEDKFDRIYIGRPDQFSRVEGEYFQANSNVVTLRSIRMNDRCLLTTVDVAKGIKRVDTEPIRTLKTYRMVKEDYPAKPVFGIDFGIDQPGILRKGDVIYGTLLS